MPLAFVVEAKIMVQRHINLRHMTFIFDERLCVIFRTFIYHFMHGECPNSKVFIKRGGRIRTPCKVLARANS